jgi:hypothetical protein
MIVHVDADGGGQDLCEARIVRFGLRPVQIRHEQRYDAGSDRFHQKLSPRMIPLHV